MLSLVLRRTHCSNYRFGRWFGPSWSSTLDVRLVVEREGVAFLGEDGVMLAFPPPENGVSVQPVAGVQRWTLTRTEVGAYQLWDQRRELIWHFAPEPGLGGLESQLGNYAVSAITDPFRNRVRFHYDRHGVPVEVSYSGGYRVLIDTASGRVTRLSVLDRGAMVLVREFAYQAGELVAETNGVGASTQYTYGEHRVTAWTDSNGNQMVNTYDESGRVVFQRGIFGVLDCDFIYAEFPDSTGSLTTAIDSLDAVTRYGFDHDLQLRDLLDPGGGHTNSDYNLDRRPLKVIGPDGALTHYRYTTEGDVAQITRPDGQAVSFEYAFRGRPTVCTDVDGSVRHQEWDGSGNLIAVTDPAGARTEYRYHPNGAVAEVIGEGGVRTVIDVDGAGLPTRITDPAGAVTAVDRDGFGRPILRADPLGAQIHYEWSVTGKLLSRTDSDSGGNAESWTYDGEGNLLTHADRAGGLTSFTYGPFALVASRTDPDGSTTDFRYDSQRRLIGVISPLGQRWSYEYDLAGRLIAETDCSGAVTHFTYDQNGRVATITADTGVTLHHSYDLLGRPIEITADTGEFVRYTYDPTGRIRTATSGTGDEIGHTLTFGYTATGECAAQQLDDEPAMRYEYDSQGRPTRRTSPSGAVTSWKYNSAGHIRSMDTDDHRVDFSYDPVGRLTGWRVGEIECSRAHTEYGCVTAQQVTAFPAVSLSLDLGSANRPDPMSVRRDEYSYRPDGYVTAHRSNGTGTEAVDRQYTLDAVGRVTAVSRNGILAAAYQYDPLSNIVAAVPHATPGAAGLELDEDGSREYRDNLLIRASGTRYHYDRSRRLIRKERTHRAREPEVFHYRYNAFGQLTDVWTPTRQWWHYTYDGLGRRVTKLLLRTDGAVVERTDFTWDGIHLIEHETEHSITRWSYEPRTLVPVTQTTDHAGVDREFLAVLTDPTGSRTDLIDTDTGQIAASSETDLWGQIVWHAGNSTPLRFPSRFHDPETGLHYDDQRYYDPETGRYIGPDPLGCDSSLNPHLYPNILRGADEAHHRQPLCVCVPLRRAWPAPGPARMPGAFDFGAEIGISAQKLHACGPIGLPKPTSTKWIVRGDGQIGPV